MSLVPYAYESNSSKQLKSNEFKIYYDPDDQLIHILSPTNQFNILYNKDEVLALLKAFSPEVFLTWVLIKGFQMYNLKKKINEVAEKYPEMVNIVKDNWEHIRDEIAKIYEEIESKSCKCDKEQMKKDHELLEHVYDITQCMITFPYEDDEGKEHIGTAISSKLMVMDKIYASNIPWSGRYVPSGITPPSITNSSEVHDYIQEGEVVEKPVYGKYFFPMDIEVFGDMDVAGTLKSPLTTNHEERITALEGGSAGDTYWQLNKLALQEEELASRLQGIDWKNEGMGSKTLWLADGAYDYFDYFKIDVDQNIDRKDLLILEFHDWLSWIGTITISTIKGKFRIPHITFTSCDYNNKVSKGKVEYVRYTGDEEDSLIVNKQGLGIRFSFDKSFGYFPSTPLLLINELVSCSHNIQSGKDNITIHSTLPVINQTQIMAPNALKLITSEVSDYDITVDKFIEGIDGICKTTSFDGLTIGDYDGVIMTAFLPANAYLQENEIGIESISMYKKEDKYYTDVLKKENGWWITSLTETKEPCFMISSISSSTLKEMYIKGLATIKYVPRDNVLITEHDIQCDQVFAKNVLSLYESTIPCFYKPNKIGDTLVHWEHPHLPGMGLDRDRTLYYIDFGYVPGSKEFEELCVGQLFEWHDNVCNYHYEAVVVQDEDGVKSWDMKYGNYHLATKGERYLSENSKGVWIHDSDDNARILKHMFGQYQAANDTKPLMDYLASCIKTSVYGVSMTVEPQDELGFQVELSPSKKDNRVGYAVKLLNDFVYDGTQLGRRYYVSIKKENWFSMDFEFELDAGTTGLVKPIYDCYDIIPINHHTSITTPIQEELNRSGLLFYADQDFMIFKNDIDYSPDDNLFRFVYDKDYITVYPKPEASDSLMTDKNIITSQIVVGQNIESHLYSINTVGNTVNEIIMDIGYIEQVLQELIAQIEAINEFLKFQMIMDMAFAIFDVGSLLVKSISSGMKIGQSSIRMGSEARNIRTVGYDALRDEVLVGERTSHLVQSGEAFTLDVGHIAESSAGSVVRSAEGSVAESAASFSRATEGSITESALNFERSGNRFRWKDRAGDDVLRIDAAAREVDITALKTKLGQDADGVFYHQIPNFVRVKDSYGEARILMRLEDEVILGDSRMFEIRGLSSEQSLHIRGFTKETFEDAKGKAWVALEFNDETSGMVMRMAKEGQLQLIDEAGIVQFRRYVADKKMYWNLERGNGIELAADGQMFFSDSVGYAGARELILRENIVKAQFFERMVFTDLTDNVVATFSHDGAWFETGGLGIARTLTAEEGSAIARMDSGLFWDMEGASELSMSSHSIGETRFGIRMKQVGQVLKSLFLDYEFSASAVRFAFRVNQVNNYWKKLRVVNDRLEAIYDLQSMFLHVDKICWGKENEEKEITGFASSDLSTWTDDKLVDAATIKKALGLHSSQQQDTIDYVPLSRGDMRISYGNLPIEHVKTEFMEFSGYTEIAISRKIWEMEYDFTITWDSTYGINSICRVDGNLGFMGNEDTINMYDFYESIESEDEYILITSGEPNILGKMNDMSLTINDYSKFDEFYTKKEIDGTMTKMDDNTCKLWEMKNIDVVSCDVSDIVSIQFSQSIKGFTIYFPYIYMSNYEREINIRISDNSKIELVGICDNFLWHKSSYNDETHTLSININNIKYVAFNQSCIDKIVIKKKLTNYYVPDMSNYYSKHEVDTMINSLLQRITELEKPLELL